MAREDGRYLALIPVTVGMVLAALSFPHDADPRDIPLPTVDERRVTEVEREDHTRAQPFEPLPAEVRALGEAVRAFNTAEAKDAPGTPWADLRRAVDEARHVALAAAKSRLVDLRATQLERFLTELQGWRKTGEETPELQAVGGSFLRRMTIEGWLHAQDLLPSEQVVRVMFKLKWNAVARLEEAPELQPSLDEMRTLYRFFLLHPHPGAGARESIAAARQNARTRADCAALAEGEDIAREQWRLDKIEQLVRIDPTYPAAYARGVSLFRAARYEASVHAFQDWLREHPDGPLTLRARNHLHAAIVRAR